MKRLEIPWVYITKGFANGAGSIRAFLMNLDESVELVKFAFEHGNPGDLFIQKADASTIGEGHTQSAEVHWYKDADLQDQSEGNIPQ